MGRFAGSSIKILQLLKHERRCIYLTANTVNEEPGNMSYCDWPPWWHRESTWDPPELRRLTTKLQGKVFGAVAGNHWNPARSLPHSASTVTMVFRRYSWCVNQYGDMMQNHEQSTCTYIYIHIYIYHIIWIYIYMYDQPIWRQLGMAKNHSPLIFGWVNIKKKPTDCETIRSPKGHFGRHQVLNNEASFTTPLGTCGILPVPLPILAWQQILLSLMQVFSSGFQEISTSKWGRNPFLSVAISIYPFLLDKTTLSHPNWLKDIILHVSPCRIIYLEWLP